MTEKARIQIFVEGIDDRKFIHTFILKFFGVNLNWDDKVKNKKPLEIFAGFQGNTGRHALIKMVKSETSPVLEEASRSGIMTLIILDCDTEEDFNQTKNMLLEIQEAKKDSFQFDFFFLPQNEEPNEGENLNLENLLLTMVHPSHRELLDSLDKLIGSLNELINPQTQEHYQILGNKERIYLLNQLFKSKKGDYLLDDRYWQLDCEKVPSLKPLYEFLKSYLVPLRTKAQS